MSFIWFGNAQRKYFENWGSQLEDTLPVSWKKITDFLEINSNEVNEKQSV